MSNEVEKLERRGANVRSTCRSLEVYPFPPILPTNPYLDLLYEHMPSWIQPHRIRPVTRGMRQMLATHEPALLHLHFFDELCQRPSLASTTVRTISFMVFLGLVRRREIPMIWTVHNDRPHEGLHPGWARRLYRYVAHSATALIAHSHAAAHTVAMRYGLSVPPFVIPHGNFIGYAGPCIDRRAARQTLGLQQDIPLILALGVLRPYKGLEDLLDAFAAIPPGTAQLMIVGEPKMAEYSATLSAQASRIPGAHVVARYVPTEDLPLYLGAADVVALPYHHLLTSGVMLWAMSYARAVIAPAFPAVIEMVDDGNNGFVFTPGDAGSLQSAIQRALNVADLERIGDAALERVRPFSWPRVAAQTALVYADAALARPSLRRL